eukprot:3438602-Prymnesium_polylepis.1
MLAPLSLFTYLCAFASTSQHDLGDEVGTCDRVLRNNLVQSEAERLLAFGFLPDFLADEIVHT